MATRKEAKYMPRKFKHISKDKRDTIQSMIVSAYKLKEIAEAIRLDPTSVSKEIKRNRTKLTPKDGRDRGYKDCKRLNRYPYVCNGCSHRYNLCGFNKYVYKANDAQRKANIKLVISRRGIDTTKEEFKKLDSLIKAGIDNGDSIYEISKNNDLGKSVSTIYRYINSGFLTTKPIDLPYAVTYKKRKKINKRYEYKENKNIDRSNHTYKDYLTYVHTHPHEFGWQLDFLGSIKSDSKSIISLIMPDIHFPLIDIMTNPDSKKVVSFFDRLEDNLGIDDFKKIFPYILTDRDPSFSDIEGICFSKITGEERTKLFFCDPYVSNQKPNIENLNKQLRKHFPKKRSIDHLTRADIKNTNSRLLRAPLHSLDGHTPQEIFIEIFGNDNFINLIK